MEKSTHPTNLSLNYRASFMLWRETQHRLTTAAFLIIGILFTGTFGYHVLENMSFFNSFYMTVITIATVGFQEVQDLSQKGRVFTVFLIFLGIGTASYSIGTIAALFVEGQIFNIFKGRKMVKEITGLTNHIIVCGYGKIGREVCENLADASMDFIVIDLNQDKIDHALEMGFLAAIGDATDDDILLKAGIKKAHGLVSAISDDSANIYLVITARALNDKIKIIARGVGESYKKKMLRAGANRVVSPFEIGVRRMAALVMRPEIVDFIEALSPAKTYGLRLQQIKVGKTSKLSGVRLDKSYIKRDTNGALVLGIEKPSTGMVINPSGETSLEPGDIMLVIGNDEQINALQKIAAE